MSTAAVTLYDLHEELYRLYELRQELMDQVLPGEADEEARRVAVRECDAAIAEQIKQLDGKVDRVAGFLREMTSRAEVHEKEARRIGELAKREKAVCEELKGRIAETLALRCTPEQILEAPQNTVLLRLKGGHSQLRLCKSPSAVEITDESLIPAEYVNVALTMPISVWEYIEELLEHQEIGIVPQVTRCIDKAGISKALKAHKPVAGARLREDSVHVKLG